MLMIVGRISLDIKGGMKVLGSPRMHPGAIKGLIPILERPKNKQILTVFFFE